MRPVIAPEIFVVGRHFRAKKSFMDGPGYFVAGEVLTFEHFGFSPYDASYVYTFRSAADGRTTYWSIHESLVDAKSSNSVPDWKELFDLIDS